MFPSGFVSCFTTRRLWVEVLCCPRRLWGFVIFVWQWVLFPSLGAWVEFTGLFLDSPLHTDAKHTSLKCLLCCTTSLPGHVHPMLDSSQIFHCIFTYLHTGAHLSFYLFLLINYLTLTLTNSIIYPKPKIKSQSP